jgi:hypothetical protein
VFWLLYNGAMVDAGLAWYRVEDTPPCTVAALGGFHNVTAAAECERRAAAAGGAGRGEAHGYLNRKNTKGRVVEWAALDGAPAPFADLRAQVQALGARLGYPLPAKV